jgi:hypothetical protein
MLGSAFLHLQEQITVAFGTKRRKAEKQREADLQKQSDAAVAAWKPSPLEEAQQKRVTGFLSDWDSGKDVSEIDYLRPYYNLYNNAADDTPDMAGEGLLGNNMLSGANGQVAGLIGKQLQSRRQQDASGQLYNAATAAHADATGSQIPFLVGTEQNRFAGKAGLADQRYMAYLNRPKKTPFWQSLLLGGMQTAGQMGAAALAV